MLVFLVGIIEAVFFLTGETTALFPSFSTSIAFKCNLKQKRAILATKLNETLSP